MQHDHNDKYEPHEESEYHFSDEEVNYEAEPEAAKPAASSGAKESIVGQFTQRRLIISIIVFLVLVFAVYKMVTPAPTVPGTEITAAPAVPAVARAPLPAPAIPQQPAAAPAMPSMPANAISQTAQPQPAVAQPAPAVPAAPQPAQQVTAPQPVVQAQPPVEQQPATPVPGVPAATYQPAVTTAPIAAMPGVIPVETTLTTPGTGGLPAVNDQALSSKANQLIVQTQANFEQKFNEINSLNQALQNQVQELNNRVGAMEGQLNQIVQVLTQQHAGQSSSTNVTAPEAPVVMEQQQAASLPPPIAEVRIPFNVQAIIPGRAWLKSENGETITVAEGDLLKNVGRVVKIDPYDGVVEINTGNRVVSLSYGNAG